MWLLLLGLINGVRHPDRTTVGPGFFTSYQRKISVHHLLRPVIT
jgi:hypothetical protein